MDQRPLTVTELTRSIKSILEIEFGQVLVQGEISNLARPSSGHVYLNLKDDNAQVAGVLFRSIVQRTRFDLENGMEVLAFGRITVYEPRGAYQIIIEHIEPLGAGALQLAFEQLKRKLAEEGLFAPEYKQELPFLPKGIGIVTSPTGAAIRDVLNVLSRRFPSIPVLINPVPVQGDQAAAAIALAIDQFQEIPDIDLLIVGRGGGSIEDLWAFNEEIVARAIFRSKIPIISAVGHETDFTIADFVADLRAPTPSAAAELAVPRKSDLVERVNENSRLLLHLMRQQILNSADNLAHLQKRLRSPLNTIQAHMQKVDELNMRLLGSWRHLQYQLKTRLERADQILLLKSPQTAVSESRRYLEEIEKQLAKGINRAIDRKKTRLTELAHVLDSASPLAVLNRGFAAATDQQQKMISSVGQVKESDRLLVHLKDGILESEIVKKTRRAVGAGRQPARRAKKPEEPESGQC